MNTSSSFDITVFIERRMKVLATVFLTARMDVHVFGIEHDFGVDMLARIAKAPSDQERIFGVLLRGTSDPLKTPEEAASYLAVGKSVPKRARRFSFPVVEVVFSMQGDQGYYAWRSEPIVAAGGVPRLAIHRAPTCQPADRKALDEIVERVSTWHDHLYSMLAVTA